MGKITAVNDELEQRFTFALLAAEQNFEGAKLAGWGLEDTSVVPGEGYVYKVTVALPEDANIKIKEGSTYAGTNLYEELPQPIGLAGIFKDSHVVLSWNYNLLSSIYTSYIVEKSADGLNFEKQNQQPIFNASQHANDNNIALYYTDSIPNDKTFYYRVKGKNAFGDVGPPSEVVNGQGKKRLEYVPHIYKKEIPTDNKVVLFWEFKEEGNGIITKFKLNKGKTNNGPFNTVIDSIPVNAREIAFKGLDRINYFTITAVGKNGVNAESLPAIVQPVDSIPPSEPTLLKGVIDTTGIVRLSWAKNPEKDLRGYRIFRANNPNIEFSEITHKTLFEETYIDTVSLKNLNQKIYYKIKAEDQRYNRSKFSDILIIDKPDLVPPSPPIVKNYEITEQGVKIQWTPSSSKDVSSHIIYRKTDNTNAWEKVYESTNSLDTVFVDTKLSPNLYSYTLTAKDLTGFESKPSSPISINWTTSKKLVDIKFSGTVNRELRFISLSWKTPKLPIVEYRLYKGYSDEGLHLYKTLNGSVTKFNDVDLEVNSSYTYGLQLITKEGYISKVEKINLKY
ncbi:fibronectin type III domain-containing protein [Zobellia uliginosa]|uniref:fibronectin type III domain-containing protein n=1 Tax=Zobellia uliginosa TaxID=143224 RepID=UPI0026E2E0CB|nr:fibronectin type III domain-containing protein [Zobellia uliginosa]MDO6515857.1 fibronectin type III domain-containing protein [Zobellia uliginosa]